ncbi:hypothetical protein ACFSKL_14960 [Belliella marina]|uniref:CPBP family intramembrane metalloprotease n=1 Tax=Belliella marina TaxID=1644146 RepID=A0ABW4VR81_9BACT
MIDIFKQELRFLKSMPHTKRIRYHRGNKAKKICVTLLFYLLIKIVVALTIGLPILALFPKISDAYILDIDLDFEGIFLIVLFVPLVEELVFRLPLKLSILRFNFFLFLISLGSFFIHMYVGFGMLLIWALSLNLFFSKKYFKLIKTKWLRYKVEVFYLFTFLFGLMHAGNFDPQILPWYVFPIVFLPQLIGGFFTAIVRLRFGFFYGVLLHSFYNGAITLIEFITES